MFLKKKPIIEFICSDYAVRKHVPVLPASEIQPEAWKNLKGFFTYKNQHMTTAKVCPALGAWLDAGYIICAPCDIDIQFSEDGFQDGSKARAVYSNPKFKTDGHSSIQLGNLLPDYKYRGVIKINQPWWIQTAPGYSCTFLPLMFWDHPFHAVPGVLESDKCHLECPINIMIKEPKDFTIKMGTPLVQIVPFKRENITAISRETTESDKTRNSKLLTQIWLKFVGVGKYFYEQTTYKIDRRDLDV
jgi:hypothetical protein